MPTTFPESRRDPVIQISIPRNILALIDRAARRKGLSRSAFGRSLVFEQLHAAGLISEGALFASTLDEAAQ